MTLTELQPEETIPSVRPAPDIGGHALVRSPGPHVSDIIRDLEHRITKPGKRRPYDELLPEERKRMGAHVEMGWAWEEIVRAAMLRTYYRGLDRFVSVGEVELDGIFGTPDWVDCEDVCVEEFKATWRSSRRQIQVDYWHWFVQMKAYCRMLDMRIARLRVFFVNGDYRDSGPQFRLWQIEFSLLELDKNWSMLLQHSKRMRR